MTCTCTGAGVPPSQPSWLPESPVHSDSAVPGAARLRSGERGRSHRPPPGPVCRVGLVRKAACGRPRHTWVVTGSAWGSGASRPPARLVPGPAACLLPADTGELGRHLGVAGMSKRKLPPGPQPGRILGPPGAGGRPCPRGQGQVGPGPQHLQGKDPRPGLGPERTLAAGRQWGVREEGVQRRGTPQLSENSACTTERTPMGATCPAPPPREALGPQPAQLQVSTRCVAGLRPGRHERLTGTVADTWQPRPRL